MGLTTLTSVKQHLGIASSNTTQDAFLTSLIGQASYYLKNELKQNFGDFIQSNSLANPTVVTSLAHGLETGDVISVTHSNCTPSIDGLQTVTRLTDDTFSVPVNVTVAGTAGSYCRQFTEFYRGSGTAQLILNQRPVLSVSAVYLDNGGYYGQGDFQPFDPTTSILVSGTDYVLKIDNNNSVMKSKCGILLRLKGFWTAANLRTIGMLTQSAIPGVGNIKVVYVAGYSPVPLDVQLLCNNVIAVLKANAATGTALQSESIEDYSYNRAVGPAAQAEIGSMTRQLKGYKELAI